MAREQQPGKSESLGRYSNMREKGRCLLLFQSYRFYWISEDHGGTPPHTLLVEKALTAHQTKLNLGPWWQPKDATGESQFLFPDLSLA